MRKFLTFLLSAFTVFITASLSYAENLRIDGSTTVLPIAQKAAEVFMKKVLM